MKQRTLVAGRPVTKDVMARRNFAASGQDLDGRPNGGTCSVHLSELHARGIVEDVVGTLEYHPYTYGGRDPLIQVVVWTNFPARNADRPYP